MNSLRLIYFMTYSDKLKSPQWQKKRLEILKRDKWKCKLCGDTETTLHIHHLKYINFKSHPADSDNKDLITYCEDCHTLVEVNKGVLDIKRIEKRKHSEDETLLLIYIYSYHKGDKTLSTYYRENGVFNFEASFNHNEIIECNKILKSI